MAKAVVTVREHAVTKRDSFGMEVTKSLNQDMVFVNDKLAGYLSHVTKKFLPLSGWNNQHNKVVCEALQKIKGDDFGVITAVDAPPIAEKLVDTEDDE